MSERQLSDAVAELARHLGWLAYHTHDSRHSAAGFPDWVLCHPVHQRLIFVELKSAKGKTTAAQEEWLAALDALAFLDEPPEVYVWRPEDWTSGRIEALLR